MKTLYKHLTLMALLLIFVGQSLGFDASKNTSVQFRVPAAGEANPKLVITHPDATQKIGNTFANNKMTLEARFKSCVITTDSNNLGNNWRPIIVALPAEPISTSSITHSSGSLRHITIFLHQNKIKFYGGQYPLPSIVGPTYNNDGDPNCSDATNQWHHAAGVIDGDKILFYVDGKLVGQDVRKAVDNLSAISTLVTSNFVVSGATWGQPPIGHVDEIRLWNVVRTAEEIALAKDVSLKGNESGLLGFWKLNEQPPVTGEALPPAADSGPNKWNGSYSGAVTLGKSAESFVAGTIPLGNTSDTASGYVVPVFISADVVPTDPLKVADRIVVNYRTNPTAAWTPVEIDLAANCAGQKCLAQIPAKPSGTHVDYKIEVQDSQGTYSIPKGDSFYSFDIVNNLAMSFDGVSGSIHVPNSMSSRFGASPSSLTIEARLKSDQDSTDAAGGWVGMVMGGSLENNVLKKNFHLYLHKNFISCFGGNYVGGIPYKDGQWHHAACVIDNANKKITLYVDGELKTDQSTNAPSEANFTTPLDLTKIQQIFIGKSFDGSSRFYKGLLDEVRVWNVALPLSGVQARANTTLTGKEPGLVAHWKLDEDPADVEAYDSAITPADATPANTANQYPGTFSSSGILFAAGGSSLGQPPAATATAPAPSSETTSGTTTTTDSGTTTTQPAPTTEPAPTVAATPTGGVTISSNSIGSRVIYTSDCPAWVSGRLAKWTIECPDFNQYLSHMSNIAYTPTTLAQAYPWNILPYGSGAKTFQYEVPTVGPVGSIYDMNFFCSDSAADKTLNVKMTAQANTSPRWLTIAGPEIQAEVGEVLTIGVPAKDEDPCEVLKYSFTHDVPNATGMSINQSTGEFKWDIISVPQSGTYHFEFFVEDLSKAKISQKVDVNIYKPRIIKLASSGNLLRYLGSSIVPINVSLFGKPVDAENPLAFTQAGIWAGKVSLEIAKADGTVLQGKTTSPAKTVGQETTLTLKGSDATWALPQSSFASAGYYKVTSFFDPVGVFTQNKSGTEAAALGEIQADSIYIEFKQVDPNNPIEQGEFKLQQAGDLILLGQYDEAIQAASGACSVESLKSACFYWQAMAYLEKKDFRAAYDFLEKALASLGPEQIEQRSNIEMFLSMLEGTIDLKLINPGDQIVDEGKPLSFTLAYLAKSTNLNFSANDLPEGASFDSASRQFSWTPKFNQAGSYTVNFSLADDQNHTDSVSVAITVNNVNGPPVMELLVNQSPITIDELNSLQLASVSEPDGEPITWTFKTNPTGFETNLSPIDNVVSFNAPEIRLDQVQFQADLTACDPQKACDTKLIDITIFNVNKPPLFADIPPQKVLELQTWTFKPVISDPDGSAELTCLASVTPAKASIYFPNKMYTYGDSFIFQPMNCGSLFTQWTPSYNDAGDYIFEWQAWEKYDLAAKTTKSFALTVENVNRAPSMGNILDLTVNENDLVSISIPASDPDNDPLTCTQRGLPAGLILNGCTNITGRPSFDSAGTYTVTVSTQDATLSSSDSFTLVVNNTNRAPAIGAIASQTIDEGKTLTVPLSVKDPDGNAVSCDVGGLPSGSLATVSCSSLSWTPTNKNAGTYTVYILAKDNGSPILNAKRSFTVTVNNLAPTLTLPYTYSTGSEGNTVSFNMTASDPDGDSTSIEVTRVYKGSTQVSVPVGSTSGSATSTICPLVSGYNHRWCWDPAGNPPGPDWTDGGAYWYIYVKATDSQGAASAEKVFTYYIYDVPPPKLTITYAEPTTHYYAYTSNYYNISANAQTSYGGNNIDYIEFKDLYGFETYTTYCYGSSNCNGSARFHFGGGFYSPSYYGWHYIQVTARDTKGQITKMTYSVYVN